MTRSPLLLVAFAVILCFAPAPSVVEYPLPRAKAFPHDPAVGADGIAWYTDQANSYIGRLGRAGDGIKQFPLPSEARDPHTPLFHRGKVWFTVQGSNLYVVLDPASSAAKIYPVPTPRARPYGLVAAPDGMIWMALFGTNQIGRIDPADGKLKIFPLPAAGARPRRLIVDAKGIVWYSDYARGKLGRLDPATGQVRDFASPGGDGSEPYGIAAGTDGRIWYDESGAAVAGAVGRSEAGED